MKCNKSIVYASQITFILYLRKSRATSRFKNTNVNYTLKLQRLRIYIKVNDTARKMYLRSISLIGRE